MAGGSSSSVANVEDLGIVLLPGEIANQFLGDVRLPTCWKSDHDDNKLRGDVNIGNTAVWRDSGTGHAGYVERRWRIAGSRCRGSGRLFQWQPRRKSQSCANRERAVKSKTHIRGLLGAVDNGDIVPSLRGVWPF